MISLNRCIALALVLFTQSAMAVEDAGGAQKALAKAQFMLRQATSEKASLQQQVDALTQQLDALRKQMASTEAAAAERSGKLEQKFSEASNQWQQRNEKSEQQLRIAGEQLKEQSEKINQLSGQLKRQDENFALCYANNRKLYDINVDLLERYRNKGVLDVVKQREPFTGVARVEVENMVQDYQYRLEDLRLDPESSTQAIPAEHRTGP